MSDHSDAPAGSGGDGRGDGVVHEPSGAGPSNWMRGLAVLIVAVVVGVLLMPSATRAPLRVVTASATSPPTTTAHSAVTTTTTTLPVVVPGASTIHVLVANGTTVSHLAAGVATYLHTRGYDILTPVNASTHVAATQVYAASGQQGSAGTVVSVLGLSATAIQPPTAVAPVVNTGGATVVVIVGPDLARFAPSSTTTTNPAG